MLNYFWIQCMSNKIPKPLLILLSFALALCVYWPSLHGKPLWDDYNFLFYYDAITKPGSYLNILFHFGWPISVITQKVFYSWWSHDYFFYHISNLLVHFLNSYLLLKLAERFKFRFSFALFLLFLLHPANVISVSWIIQLKTLLCFTFFILSLLFFSRRNEGYKWYALSLLCFVFSALSKSASLPLPLLLLIYQYSQGERKKLFWLIPFFLVSAAGGYRLLRSPITVASLEKMNPEKFVMPKAPDVPTRSETFPPKEVSESPAMDLEILQVSDVISMYEADEIPEKFSNIPGTIQYYFWQILLPLENPPVKGQRYSSPGAIEYLHFFLLFLIVYINWRKPILLFLASGYIMLVPFLGIISAPFMNITWVSDQHLYLSMPFFLIFWLMMIEKIPQRWFQKTPYAVVFVFALLTFKTSAFYKNEVTFYEASLRSDPLNAPIAYNLAVAYLNEGQMQEAYDITEEMVHLATQHFEVRNHGIYSAIFLLNHTLKQKLDEKL